MKIASDWRGMVRRRIAFYLIAVFFGILLPIAAQSEEVRSVRPEVAPALGPSHAPPAAAPGTPILSACPPSFCVGRPGQGGSPGQSIYEYQNYANCGSTGENCGTETWYVKGLPPDIATYTIDPPITTGGQNTKITITISPSTTISETVFQIGADCSNAACEPEQVGLFVNQTKPPPQLKIIFNGNDVTNTKNPVKVALGQKIALTTSGIDGGQNPSWTVSDETVGGYVATGDFNTTGFVGKGKVEPTDFTQSSTTFFWTTLGTKNVTYTVQLKGKTYTAKTTFEVQGPTCDSDCVTIQRGNVQTYYYDNLWWLSFGNVHTVTPHAPGIEFTESAGASPVPGQFVWVQLIDSDYLVVWFSAGGNETCTFAIAGVGGLDTDFPYEANATSVDDSPNSAMLSTWKKAKQATEFRMFLMWQSSTSDSIPVPLGHVAWTFSGTAVLSKKVVPPVWSLESSATTASSFIPGHAFPLWTRVSGAIPCG